MWSQHFHAVTEGSFDLAEPVPHDGKVQFWGSLHSVPAYLFAVFQFLVSGCFRSGPWDENPPSASYASGTQLHVGDSGVETLFRKLINSQCKHWRNVVHLSIDEMVDLYWSKIARSFLFPYAWSIIWRLNSTWGVGEVLSPWWSGFSLETALLQCWPSPQTAWPSNSLCQAVVPISGKRNRRTL